MVRRAFRESLLPRKKRRRVDVVLSWRLVAKRTRKEMFDSDGTQVGRLAY